MSKRGDNWIVRLHGASCTGCSACAAICPKGAIRMEADVEGFLRPTIDDERCITCMLCRKVCPVNGSESLVNPKEESTAYAFISLLEGVRERSSSGGAFTSLANYILGSGGVVYGAVFTDDYRVKHERFEDSLSVRACCGSKYVQSDVSGVPSRVLSDLAQGRKVLFSGTPCQVAGIKSLVKMKRRNLDGLLTCDLLCHGAASPMVFADHITFIEGRHGQLETYNFRFKPDGSNWHLYKSLAVTRTGECTGRDVTAFQECFDFSYINRPSCATCPFARRDRVGDVSLGDYWGVEKHHPELDDDRGTSLVLINTKKGVDACEKLKKDGKLRGLSKGEYEQAVLIHPCAPSKDRDSFWQIYRKGGYVAAIRRYTCFGLLRRVLRLSRKGIRNIMGKQG